MVISVMFINYKTLIIYLLFNLFFFTSSSSALSEETFNSWLTNYKEYAIEEGVSEKTVNLAFKNVKFIEKVIKYDRKQPEFFEDTNTYVSKRANLSRLKISKQFLKNNKKFLNTIEKEFNVEKEILLALWGIETNFGKHVGKMDIISCLATLSYDKRRSKFFSAQLLTLLKLIDKNLVDYTKLYGSWAGAYGNFQFMPSTINNYAIDYDGNNKIELKSINDSFASAANYINKIGWKRGEPCFYKVKLNKKIKKKYFNMSARKLSNKLKVSDWVKKGVVKHDDTKFKFNLKAALILPDGKPNSPTFLVFDNYEKILKWNRSLRFGISVCTLSEMIKA